VDKEIKLIKQQNIQLDEALSKTKNIAARLREIKFSLDPRD